MRSSSSLAALLWCGYYCYSLILSSTWPIAQVNAWITCPSGDACPDDNTCCQTCRAPHSLCITPGHEQDQPVKNTLTHHNNNNLQLQQQQGACCTDDPHTGCGSGYECISAPAGQKGCNRTTTTDSNSNRDPEDETPPWLPRYKLCSLPVEAYSRVYGLPVVGTPSTVSNQEEEEEDEDHDEESAIVKPQLAYLSTMHALDSRDPGDIQQHMRVTTVVIMIHGSRRNVDDYLCTTYAALPPFSEPQQNNKSYSNSNHSTIMVVAPWFLADSDRPVSLYEKPTVPALRWIEHGPRMDHTWRYGAEDASGYNISSYAAVDALMYALVNDPVRFASLKRIVVAGHSAGGQFTQRWALLSPVIPPLLNKDDSHSQLSDDHPTPTITTITTTTARMMMMMRNRAISVRTVVANPKSFCYLDHRRFDPQTQQLRVPSAWQRALCRHYDEWEWGLGRAIGGFDFLPTPYKDQSIQNAGGMDQVIHRYATRDVVYLAGELDTLPNGMCMETMQGAYRRIRSEHFYESIKEIYNDHGQPLVHKRLVVQGVHHDHALMFQSPEGNEALFGET